MIYRQSPLVQALQLFDLLIMVGAFFGMIWVLLPSGLSPAALLEERLKVSDLLLFLGLVLAWHLSMKVFGLYSPRHSSTRSIGTEVFKATSLGSLVVVSLGVTFELSLIHDWRWFVAAFWATSTTMTVVVHLIVGSLHRSIRWFGPKLRNILVVGTNHRAITLATHLQNRPEFGYRVIGFVDDAWPGLEDFQSSGHTLVTDLEGLPEFLRRNIVDEVVLTLPIASFYPQMDRIMNLCKEQGITAQIIADHFDQGLPGPDTVMFFGYPVIRRQCTTVEGFPILAKRVLDFFGSLALLIALFPLLLVIAAAIKVFSPGPLFFAQERLGLNKRRFLLYKFRTMVINAEEKLKELEALNESEGPVFKISRDPRLTPIGSFLRRTSADELPMLFSVLIGDMSLVGPRPLPERDYEGFSEDWHRRRFSVKPGITCLWQVSGRYNITFDRWMELDMEYIDRWSLWLDLIILLRTVPVVIKGTGSI